MSRANLSASAVTITAQSSLWLTASGDGPLSAWYVHSDGQTLDGTGVYSDTVTGSYTNGLRTSSDGEFLPFVVLSVTNSHGIYIGSEWGNGAPRFPTELIVGYTQFVNAHNDVLTCDVSIQRNGLILEPFIAQLHAIGN